LRTQRLSHTAFPARGYIFLLPPVMMRTPISVSAVESVGKPEPRPIIAIARGNDHGNYWRRGVEDRARWRRRVIVSRCGSAVRLNHFSAGIRAQSRRKPECEHRQCYHNRFFYHDRLSLLLFRRLNPKITAELPTKSVRRPCSPRRVCPRGTGGSRVVANALRRQL
jgi:hypothetical protein